MFHLPRLLLILIIGCGSGLPAQSLFRDPGLPDSESTLYASSCDQVPEQIRETMRRAVVDGREVYLDTMRSQELDRYLTVDRATFQVVATHTVRHGPEAEVETIQLVRRRPATVKVDQVRVSDFYGLRFLLRGYPFEKPRTIPINMLNGHDDVTMQVKYAGLETVDRAGTPVACHKLELSFAGIVGAFLPKSQLWYQMDAPHALVRFAGASEFNRKVKCAVQAVEYKAADGPARP